MGVEEGKGITVGVEVGQTKIYGVMVGLRVGVGVITHKALADARVGEQINQFSPPSGNLPKDK